MTSSPEHVDRKATPPHLPGMSNITAVFEAHPDGSLHLPLPEELRHSKVKVTATLEAVPSPAPCPRFGSLAGKIWMAPDFNAPLKDF